MPGPYNQKDMSRTDRSKWQTAISRLDDQPGADDYWLKMPPKERVEFAWALSEEVWALAHPEQVNEPGLSRSVARVVRRKG